MKKALKLAVPAVLIIAMFVIFRISPDSRLMYSDISGHWAMNDIVKWSERGIMSGTDGNFRPDDGVTLAELATVFTRILPLEDTADNIFSDVEDDAWYTDAVLKCVAAGIIDARGKSDLAPKEQLSREEAFMMIARAFDIRPQDELTLLSGCNDAKLISPEHRPYFEAMLKLDIISGGNEVQVYPREGITRAEIAAELEKLESAGYI